MIDPKRTPETAAPSSSPLPRGEGGRKGVAVAFFAVIVVLGSAQPEGKVSLIVGVTRDIGARAHAGKIVGAVAKLVGGAGGGKPDIAEAGGKDVSQLDAALTQAPDVIAALLA